MNRPRAGLLNLSGQETTIGWRPHRAGSDDAQWGSPFGRVDERGDGMAAKLQVARLHYPAGWLPAEDLVDVAVQALVDGWDSPSLRSLAGLIEVDQRDAPELFARALVEVGLPPLSKHEALWEFIYQAAEQLARGERDVREGLRAISRSWSYLGCPDSLALLMHLADEWETWSTQRPRIEADLRAAIGELLATRPPNAPGSRAGPVADQP